MPTETLQKFFTDKNFMIPEFQRDYAWDSSNIDELFDDISEALETSTEHYIGTFILSKGGKDGLYKVVDGQQRLTTLTMMLHSMIDKLQDQKRKIIYSCIFLEDIEGNKKLSLLGDNSQFFYDLLSNKQPQATSKSQERLRDGYGWICKRVAELFTDRGENGLVAWLDCIKSLEILEFVEPDEGKAIRMFQSVNDRGVPLSNMDKAKSLLIYYSNRFLKGELDGFVNAEFARCFKSYSQIKNLASESGFEIKNIGRATFTEDDILRYHYLAFDASDYIPGVGFVYRATSDYVLNHFLKPSLKTLRNQPEHLARFIRNYVADLSKFFLALRQLLEGARNIEALFQTFVVLDLSAFLYPLTIRLQTRDMLTSALPGVNGHSFLSMIETVDMRIYKLRGTDPARDILEISHSAEHLSATEIANRLRSFVHDFMDDDQFVSQLGNRDIYRNPGLYRILTEVEKDARVTVGLPQPSLSDLQALIAAEQSVEHILPQEPSFGFPSYGFANREEYDQAKHRLGNLSLLTKAENSRCNNEPVQTKFTADNLYRSSIYHMTRQIAAKGLGHENPFGKEEIEHRGINIAKFCLTRWPLWNVSSVVTRGSDGGMSELVNNTEISSASVLVPHAIAKPEPPTIRVTKEKLLEEADRRKVRPLVAPFQEILVGTDEDYVHERASGGFGGSLKYVRKGVSGKQGVAFRLVVCGNGDTPEGKLELWVNITYLGDILGISETEARTLIDALPGAGDYRKTCSLLLSDPTMAKEVALQFRGWYEKYLTSSQKSSGLQRVVEAPMVLSNEEANKFSNEEVIVKIGAEGGDLTLYGARTGNVWRFKLNVYDCTPLLLEEDEEPVPYESEVSSVPSWPEAIAILDRYPWANLYPMAVHPEFRKQVWSEVQRRLDEGEENEFSRNRWRKLCEVAIND